MHLLDEGRLVPVTPLGAELEGTAATRLPARAVLTVVVAAAAERRVALVVDELLDEREIAVKPLSGRFRALPYVGGTTILSDGRPGWVVDIEALAAAARGAGAAEETRAYTPKRVLVVDDSATTRELERTLLRAAGFDVETAPDGERAFELLSASPFDVVVSDIEMPRLDGFGLLGRIRATARLADLPVVLVTALDDPTDRQRALDMGASAYILKSTFDEDELLDVIGNLV